MLKQTIKKLFIGLFSFFILFFSILGINNIIKNNKKTDTLIEDKVLEQRGDIVNSKEKTNDNIVRAVQYAETEKTKETISYAQNLVNKMTESSLKKELNERLGILISDYYIYDNDKNESEKWETILYYETIGSEIYKLGELFETWTLLNSYYMATEEWESVLYLTLAEIKHTNKYSNELEARNEPRLIPAPFWYNGSRYYTEEQVEEIREFSNSIKRGDLAEFNRKKWGKRGEEIKKRRMKKITIKERHGSLSFYFK